MSQFSFKELEIKGVYIVEAYISEDNRGSFVKSFEKNIFKENGIEFECTEDFISRSTKNVVRGMHFQLYHPQIKLVGVIRGKVFDVVVDLREESKTYGKWIGVYLSQENRSSVLIPRGCAHGFISLTDDSIVSYKCDGKYDKESDTGIMWNDQDIAIEWPIGDLNHVVLGRHDKNRMSFKYFNEKCKFIY